MSSDKQTSESDFFWSQVMYLFQDLLSISESSAKSIHRKNIHIKLEICTYLFWVVDYALVQNKIQVEIRTAINKVFDDMFSESKHWRKLRLKNLSSYVDDRLTNYTEISLSETPFSQNYYERLIEYQTELILWVTKNKQPRLGFIAVPKKRDDHSPIDLDAIKRQKVSIPIQETLISTIIPFTKNIINELNDDYFIKEK